MGKCLSQEAQPAFDPLRYLVPMTDRPDHLVRYPINVTVHDLFDHLKGWCTGQALHIFAQ